MLITCPACAATYDLPAALVVKLPARTRCARCRTEWEVMPPAAAPTADPAPIITEAPPVTPEPVAPAMPEPVTPAPAAPERRQTAGTAADRAESTVIDHAPEPTEIETSPNIAFAPMPDPRLIPVLWASSIGIVVVLIALILLLHGPIATAWPPSLRLYRAIGLA